MQESLTVDKPKENLIRAGEIFMYSVWLQGQMSDLTILKNNPGFVEVFVNNPEKVPDAFHKERIKYWEKQFFPVKEDFKTAFSGLLTESEKQDLEEIFHVRNMIAHAHISFGRDYMLFRPSANAQKEKRIFDALQLKTVEDQSDPMIIKIEFWRDEIYLNIFNTMKRFDEICLERISKSINVPHGRIR